MIRRPRWWPSKTKAIGAVPPPSCQPGSEGRLFIVGAARSGTTVLQNALNDSPNIFLFGEPDFQAEDGVPGFAARYNAMHRAWSNHETKSTFCPRILADDGTWNDYLLRLGQDHRYVGAKFVINPVREREGLERLFDFQCRHFYRAKHIFTFRRPVPTVFSTRDLQLLGRGESDELRLILRSYAETIALYIRMSRNLPQVRAVFHEDMDRSAFEDLERWLDLPLPRSHRYYESSKVRRYPDPVEYADMFSALQRIYDQLRSDAKAEFRALQAEQNDNHLSEGHFTPIGKLHREVDAIIRELGPKD